jgi:hypothetical protein
MTKIIGFTDSVTECECCGKINLKGTYCIDINGLELYYGSVCAFKNHGVTIEEQKYAKAAFTKEQKNAFLVTKYITPLILELEIHLERIGERNCKTALDYIYEYKRVMGVRAKKYKITIPELN